MNHQIQRYIEQNPVKAGLVAHAELFPWSSLSTPGRHSDGRLESSNPTGGKEN